MLYGSVDWLRRPAPQSVDGSSSAAGPAPQPMMQYRHAVRDGGFDGNWGGSTSQRLVTSQAGPYQGNHGHDKQTTPWSYEQSAPWTLRHASSSSWTSHSNLTESMSGFLAEMGNPELSSLAWLSEQPSHGTTSTLPTPENTGGDECSTGPRSEKAETEEWEMYLNVPEDGSVENGAMPAGSKGFHYGNPCLFGSITLLLLYREIYAKFFWSITPLAAAAMSEEMVRYALEANENDGQRDDLALRLNVFVGLAFGAIHSAHKELATQLIERAKSILRAVFDYSDYAVAQALYAISVYCIYVERDIDKCGRYMSLAAAICRDLGLLNSDTFLRCIYGVSFLPATSTQDMIRLRREYLNARKKPYHQMQYSASVLESADLPLIAVMNRGNTVGLLLLSVMSGLSIYKLRVEKNSSDPNLQQVGRQRLLSLLHALKQLEDELIAEDDSVEAADDSTNSLKEDERLPYMDRMSFLICARALMVDCFRSLESFDDALRPAAQLMKTMKRTAHYMQFMYCGMHPMITIAVETYYQMCQLRDLRDLLDIVRPWATVYPFITDLYSSWTQLLEGKEPTNQPLPHAAVITSALDLAEESEGVGLTNGRVDRKRKQEETVDVLCSLPSYASFHSASSSPASGSGSETSTPPLPAVISNSTMPSPQPSASSMYLSTPSATTSSTVPSYTPTSNPIPTPTATLFTSRPLPLRSAPLATESSIDEPGQSSSSSTSSSPASSFLSKTSSLPTPKVIIELDRVPTQSPPPSHRTGHLATVKTSPKRPTTSASKASRSNEKEGDGKSVTPPKKTDQWRWHKFAVVSGDELVQVKERRTRQRRRHKKEGSPEDS